MSSTFLITQATRRILVLLFVFIAISINSTSQLLNWAFKAGDFGRDEGSSVHTDNAGNVVVTGLFSGTVDFDPSPATFNLTSNGSEDIFVAKYSANGLFQWAFRVGGANRDHGLAITTDQNNNIIVTGFFRGSNIDFDPSPAVANLTSNGDSGVDPGYGGDIFLAKYNAAGQYQWAFNMGGSQLYDSGISIAVDPSSNIYLGGYFKEIVDFDPSAAVANLNSSLGTIFLAKYNSSGQYQWAFNTGLGDNDNAAFDLRVDNSGNLYVAGYFQGTNIDFDPGAGTALLSSNGGFEIFFAKYTTNGQYVFAKSIGGFGTDVARGIELDNSGNIYVIGDFSGMNIDFNPGAGTALLSSNGAADVFFAKYDNNGNYIWAFNFGGAADDYGWKVSTDNSHLFITGGLNGIADMNPSPVVDNLVSNGGNDIFLGKYNLNGEYLCAFSIGGSQNDWGTSLKANGSNIFYLTGSFRGTNVDFDPTTTTVNLSSAGIEDAFLTKFTWPDNTPPDGTITGGTICIGAQAQMTFNATAGTGPFTIVYNNGTSNITVNNVQSGVPFNITPNPTTTTTYTLVSIRDAVRCSETRLVTGVTATVIVNNCNATCTYWPIFGANTYSTPIPFSNNLSVSFSNPSSLLPNTAYNTMTPGNWFTPNPTIATSSPPNSTAHNPSNIGAITIYPTVVGNSGTIAFGSPTTTGFYLHVYQTVSTLDFDHSFVLVSSDGDLHVGSSGSLTNNVLIPDVGPNQSPDDANATIYFPPGITQIKFTITGAPLPSVSLDGIKLAFTFPDNCLVKDTTINDYTPVFSFDPCANKITVEDGSAFKVGDTVLLIQMKGAVIDSSNTSAFGTITSYGQAGNYEFNYVKTRNGNVIEFLNKLTRQYDIPNGKVQLIRVPYYQTLDINSVITCPAWDGLKGGILVFNVADTLKINNTIHADGKGFRGGTDPVSNPVPLFCYENQLYYPPNPDLASEKGESIYNISSLKSFGKGANANGGGGGNSHNSGGGGGSNGNAGGMGGYNYELTPCNTQVPFDNRGFGGKGLTYNNGTNKIFFGGGGGAGQSNNPEGFQAKGGNGGGIIIIKSRVIVGNNNNISSKGNDGFPCSGLGATGCHEGMGGAGAGGTILIESNSYIGNLNINTQGGKGADMIVGGNGRLGPGGGGGGGVTWLSSATTPGAATILNNGGASGVNTNYSNDAWGATAGQNGQTLYNLNLPFDNTPFKPNIDSVRIKDSLTSCTNFDFKGFGFTNTNPISSWQWFFGDGQTANTQNTSHTYVMGTYTVKLIVTDINGCRDSITKNIVATSLTADAGPDSTICSGQSVLLPATTNGGTQFQWTPAVWLNNNSILNPTANPPDGSTTFYLTAANANGCSQTDSIKIFVRSQNSFSINSPGSICRNGSVQLIAQGGDIYSWQPSTGINNPTISNPFVNPSVTTTYTVQITDTVCNFSRPLSAQVIVLDLPNVKANKQNDIDCTVDFSQLTASGAVKYSWSPVNTLNNPLIVNPIARPAVTTQYIVKGTDQFGCSNYDTLIVTVGNTGINSGYLMASAFTPNNDGVNDCFGIKYWGLILELEFNIFNRWGELVFHTTNPADCWNGKFRGIEQKSDVYVYWIRAKTTCESSVFRKGVITLIR